MASTIKLKNGSGAPLAGDLVQGEPALDLTNKRLYTEDSGGNVIEVGVNPTSITTGTITASGEITANGGIALGDNDKATFGASDDLQIYHDGSHSRLKEVGTGSFYFDVSNALFIRRNDTSATMASFENGAAKLHFDNSAKLSTTATGVDVTGTIVADGIYLGGTGAANLLDDYEEGTWTPTLVGNTTAGSYSISAVNCRYTKIGRQVTVEGQLTITVSSAGTGLAKFGGLPFACDGTPVPVGNVRVSGIALPSSTLYAVASFFTSNSSDFSVSGTKDSTAPQTLDISGISTSDVLRISMTYITAS